MRTTVMWLLLGVFALLGGQPSEAGMEDHAQARDQHGRGDGQGALAVDRYVAIGDSYTAGSGIPPDDGSGCLRSERNYPKRLADRLGAHLDDMSCGGAVTDHVDQPQQMPTVVNPPQATPLGRATDLVTFSLGVNDAGFGMVLDRCVDVAYQDPQGSPCRTSFQTPQGDAVLGRIPAVEAGIERGVRLVQKQAPRARVVLIGYPQLVPPHGTCPDAPFAVGDYAYVGEFIADVDGAVQTAARHTGAAYVDLLRASAGHDVCAGDAAWVLGNIPSPRTMVWHPFPSEQRAVAALVLDALRSGAR